MEFEYEAKVLICEEKYDKILQKYPYKEIFQVNQYFDTSTKFYKSRNSALRIRIKNNTYEFTLKYKKGSCNIEHNNIISKEEYEKFLIDGIVPVELPFYHTEKLSSVTIETVRNVIEYKEHKIEVDKSCFNGVYDYEIEVEAENIILAKRILKDFLNDNLIEGKESKSKIARYYDYN